MLKLKNTMKLNKEQAKHLAGTFRVVAIAQFGFFGYHGLVSDPSRWIAVLWSVMFFIGLEFAAIWILEE